MEAGGRGGGEKEYAKKCYKGNPNRHLWGEMVYLSPLGG